MQTSQERATGVGPTGEYKGTRIPFMPWDGEDVALMRSRLRSVLPDPMNGLQDLIKDLHPEVQKAVAIQAYNDRKALGQLNTPAAREYFMTPDGMAFLLWLSIRKTLPQESFDQVLAWTKEQGEKFRSDLLEKLQDASGFGGGPADVEDLEKNSRGQRMQKRARKPLTGSSSTGSSPSDTLGRRRKFLSDSPTPSS